MLSQFSLIEIYFIGSCLAVIANKWFSSIVFNAKNPFYLSAIPIHALFLFFVIEQNASPWFLVLSMLPYPYFGLFDAKKDHNTYSRFYISKPMSWVSLISLALLIVILAIGEFRTGIGFSCLLFVFYSVNLSHYLKIRLRQSSLTEKVFWAVVMLLMSLAFIYLLISIFKGSNSSSLLVTALGVLGFSGIPIIYFYIHSYRVFIQKIDHKRNHNFKANLSLINSNKILKSRLLSYENKAINNQMNPHFMYNAINSINALILAEEEKLAAMYIDELSELLKRTLVISDSSFNSLEDELSIVHSYVELENLRLNSAVKLESVIQSNIDKDNTFLPHLFFQSVIENSIWHGLADSSDGLIRIHISSERSLLTIRIVDNGIGIKASLKTASSRNEKHKSAGLVIIKNRLEVLKEYYKSEAYITVEDRSDISPDITGTEVLIVAPLIHQKPKLELLNKA